MQDFYSYLSSRFKYSYVLLIMNILNLLLYNLKRVEGFLTNTAKKQKKYRDLY